MPPAQKTALEKIRIAIVSQDPLRSVGLRSILESEPDFLVAAAELTSLLRPVNCDLLLLGVHGVPALFDQLITLRVSNPSLKILLTGAPPAEEKMIRAIACGVKGYLDEAARPEEYKNAIRVVMGGSMWVPRRVLAKFVDRVTANPQNLHFQPPNILSERERQVLELLVAGCTNKEIGFELGIEERTVKAHISKLMHKAGVENRIALSVHALSNSLLTPD
jgi:DNA-binding NarL/FixJ family response regulator